MRAALLAAALLLAGCVQPGPGADAAPGPSTPPGNDPAGPPPPLRLPTLLPAPGAAVSGGSEPSILADRNGRFLWVADSDGGSWSTDNGTTWGRLPNFVLPGAFTDGWALAQDGQGRLYAAALQGSVIDVARSSDGMLWEQVTHAAAVSGITDRPWMAARGDGEVVLFYFDVPVGEHCLRSTDGGATWLDRNPRAGPAQGGRAFFDAAGAFYFSSDDGRAYRFEGGCGTGPGTPVPFLTPGTNNMIQALADGDTLYMAAATEGARTITLAGRRPDGDVELLAVSPPQLQANAFATLAVREGQVAVAWYGSESAGDPSGAFAGEFNVYVSVVRGFWDEPEVTSYRVTQTPNHRGPICMAGIACTQDRGLLDYFMVDYDAWGGLHVAYADDVAAPAGASYHAHFPPVTLPPPRRPTADPHAAFVATPLGLTLRADASPSEAAEGATLASFAWDWGDGETGAGLRANHTYAGIGAYTVRLTVTDSEGRTASAAQNVLVDGTGAPPTPPVVPSPAPPTGSGTQTPSGSASSTSKAAPLPLPLLALALAALCVRRTSVATR